MNYVNQKLQPAAAEFGLESRSGIRSFLQAFNPFLSSKNNENTINKGAAPKTSEQIPSEQPVTPKPISKPPMTSNNENSQNLNVFSAGLVIEGNVTAETNLLVKGTVKGNIVCHSDIELGGEVIGDIEGKNIRICHGTVKGNISCGESLTIEKSSITGNLAAGQACINNRIEGDINVRGTLSLLREANIQGNITAAALSVEEGAMLTGRVTITGQQGGESPSQKKDSKPAKPNSSEPASSASSNTAKPTVSAMTAHRPVQDNFISQDSITLQGGAIAIGLSEEPKGQSSKTIKNSIGDVLAVTGVFLWGVLLLICMLQDIL